MRLRWYCFILVCLAFVLYGNTLTHQYALDDFIVITGNAFTKQGLQGLTDIFTHDAFEGAYGKALELSGGRYRPLSIAMFAVEYEWFGPEPFYGHLFNILFYALSGIVLFLFVKQVVARQYPWLAFIVAVLFLIHPIHTEVVANIKSRDEILALFLSLVVLLGIFSRNKWIVWLGSPVIYFFALLSKENAITFLAIIPLTLYYFSSKKLSTILQITLPFVLTALLYLWLRDTYAGMIGDRVTTDIMDDPYLFATWDEKYATIAYTIGKYFELLVFPHTLSSDYSFNQIPLIKWTDFKAWFSLVVILSLLVYAFLTAKKKSVISYGIFFFFITFSIVSNVVFNVGTSMAERFIYMPSVGFAIVAGVLVARFMGATDPSQAIRRIPLAMGILLVVIPFSYKTVARNGAWENNFELYKEDVNNAPGSARIHLYYGIELIGRYNKTNQSQTLDQALSEIQKAIEINPRFHHAHYNLAVGYEKRGDIDNAIASHKRVLEIQPQHIKSTLALGLMYGKVKKEYALSVQYFELLLNSNYREAHLFDNLGIAYAMLGNLDAAAETFQHGVRLHPNNARLHLNMAITYDNLGNKEMAERHYTIAMNLDPGLTKPN